MIVALPGLFSYLFLHGYTLLFLFLLKTIDCSNSLELTRLCFEQKFEKYLRYFLSENFQILEVIFYIFE